MYVRLQKIKAKQFQHHKNQRHHTTRYIHTYFLFCFHIRINLVTVPAFCYRYRYHTTYTTPDADDDEWSQWMSKQWQCFHFFHTECIGVFDLALFSKCVFHFAWKAESPKQISFYFIFITFSIRSAWRPGWSLEASVVLGPKGPGPLLKTMMKCGARPVPRTK